MKLCKYQKDVFHILQQEGRRCKDKGIRLYQAHNYNQAIVCLGLAREFIPRSMNELHAQVQSYLASCHFSLQQYPEALEAGKEAYKIRPGRAQVCLFVCIGNVIYIFVQLTSNAHPLHTQWPGTRLLSGSLTLL